MFLTEDHLNLPDVLKSVSFPASGVPFSLGNTVFVFPGFADVHVHLREPGFSYKETIESGTRAAAHGGYTTVCAMPNLNPVPDKAEALAIQKRMIAERAAIRVYPYGAISMGEQGRQLADLSAMAQDVCAFSDDGRGVQDEGVMREAMLQAKMLGKVIAAHCEDNALLNGGYIHDGEYCRRNAHRGICSKSEWGPIERDLKLAEQTGCSYHVCHVSTKESVQLIRDAKKSGIDVTCETAPHYLTLCDADLQEDGRFKMNPPLRSRADMQALLEGLCDGTIDMIATDHAPHSAEEKSRGLKGSLMGVVGLETAFPALYTKLVQTGMIKLERLSQLLGDNPRRRFNLPGGYEAGDCTVWSLGVHDVVNPNDFLSMGRATPFAGMQVSACCLCTVCAGKVVYQAQERRRI